MESAPYHLFLPLAASLLFVTGLLFVKRATSLGVNSWTVTFLANQFAAVFFSALWLVEGPGQPWYMLWQPAIVACLYIAGLTFTFTAIDYGDVSIATPVFGMKVLFVAIIVTLFAGTILPVSIYAAAALAVLGIGLIQWTGYGEHHRRLAFTICFALCAATSFATFDVVVQTWAPAWGSGRFLPIVYWIVALLSLGFLPLYQSKGLKDPQTRGPLLAGAALIGLQAVCITFCLASFGDATRVNVVYATRGLWGVVFAWIVANIWGGNEASVPGRLMLVRLGGAILLTTAVIVALMFGDG